MSLLKKAVIIEEDRKQCAVFTLKPLLSRICMYYMYAESVITYFEKKKS